MRAALLIEGGHRERNSALEALSDTGGRWRSGQHALLSVLTVTR